MDVVIGLPEELGEDKAQKVIYFFDALFNVARAYTNLEGVETRQEQIVQIMNEEKH